MTAEAAARRAAQRAGHPAEFIRGEVIVVAGDGTATVVLNGNPASATYGVAGIRSVGGYTPAVGDQVYLVKIETDMWLIGAVNQAPLVPAGSLVDYAGAAAPEGWLLCDGSAVTRADHAALFAAIGITYGAGDGSTTFNVPDFRDRMAIGKSGSKALGATGGAADAIVVAHDHNGTTGGPSGLVDQHQNYTGGAGAAGTIQGAGGHAIVSNNINAHLHDFTTSTEGAPGTNANLPPYVAVNKIIKI